MLARERVEHAAKERDRLLLAIRPGVFVVFASPILEGRKRLRGYRGLAILSGLRLPQRIDAIGVTEFLTREVGGKPKGPMERAKELSVPLDLCATRIDRNEVIELSALRQRQWGTYGPATKGTRAPNS